MSHSSIELREVTKKNWLECINLKLGDGQAGFVSSNLFSLAQSKFEPCCVPCAIYNEANEMVGFVMDNDSPLDDGTYRLSRMMIDEAHQGKGYGRAAVIEVLDRMKAIPDCHEIILDYVADNEVAAKFLGVRVYDV